MGPLVFLASIRLESAHALTSYGGKRFFKIESQKLIAPYWSWDFRPLSIWLAGRGSSGHVDVDPARIGPRVLELWAETVFEI
ncbi:MAG: hypothetical protein GY820_42590 [Gammaproteobacteria bacterium]|nr:hypothetical protein [Gammaproteobacteria bacterium]